MSESALPTKEEVMAAGAKELKAICADLGIKPKGKVDAIREAILDELEARAKPGPPLTWDELERLSDEQVVAVLDSLGFKSRGKKSKLRDALAKHLGIDKPQTGGPAGRAASDGKTPEAVRKDEGEEPSKSKTTDSHRASGGLEEKGGGAAESFAMALAGAPRASKGEERAAPREVEKGKTAVSGMGKIPPVDSASAPSATAPAPAAKAGRVGDSGPTTAHLAFSASPLQKGAGRASPGVSPPDPSRSLSRELQYGIMLSGLGKYDEAIVWLRKAMEAAKSQHEESLCSLYLGNAHNAKGLRFEAAPYYDDVEDIAGLKALATENRAMAAAGEGDLEQAVQIFEELIAKDPALKRVWFRRGETLLLMGKPGAALQSFDKMDRGSDGTGLLLKGAAFQRMGLAPKAKEQVNEALRSSGTNRRAWLAKALLALESGDAGEAELAISRALSVDKDDKTAWACKAALLQVQGRSAEALEALSALDPKGRLPQLDNARAFILLKLDRLDDALALADKPEHAKDADAHNLAGIVLLRKGDEKGARARFEKAVELAPDFQDALGNLRRMDVKAPVPRRASRDAGPAPPPKGTAEPASGGGDCQRCEAKGSVFGGRCTLCGDSSGSASKAQVSAPQRMREEDEPGRCPHCGFFVGEGADFCPACESRLAGPTLSEDEKIVVDFLSNIEGVGRERACGIIRYNYRTMSSLRKATKEELVQIPGVSVDSAKRILEALK